MLSATLDCLQGEVDVLGLKELCLLYFTLMMREPTMLGSVQDWLVEKWDRLQDQLFLCF